MWATIIFYPLWIVADTCFVNAIAFHTPVAIALGVLVFAMLAAGTVAFSVVSAAVRASSRFEQRGIEGNLSETSKNLRPLRALSWDLSPLRLRRTTTCS